MTDRTAFEPRLLAFLCHWCAYAAADLAGVSRFQYPSNLRIVRVTCSGRVDPAFVMDAFLAGMDGVLVGGCHLGDCHYTNGNHEALNVVLAVTVLLKHAGLSPQRLRLEWMSAAEGARFAEVVTSFTAQLKALGPVGSAEHENSADIPFGLRAARAVAGRERLRWIIGQLTPFVHEGNRYGELYTGHELRRLLDGVILDEFRTCRILLHLAQGPASDETLASLLCAPLEEVSRHLEHLRRLGEVQAESRDGRSYNANGGVGAGIR